MSQASDAKRPRGAHHAHSAGWIHCQVEQAGTTSVQTQLEKQSKCTELKVPSLNTMCQCNWDSLRSHGLNSSVALSQRWRNYKAVIQAPREALKDANKTLQAIFGRLDKHGQYKPKTTRSNVECNARISRDDGIQCMLCNFGVMDNA